jgi:UDP-4-amino-4-deoxy-L-arabinose formyltransferase/UDP-glucuronic acid dehydrogenase (UDP-4-keto-hexauronic acid decarboxylating)
MSSPLKLAILGSKGTTLDLIAGLAQANAWPISAVVILNAESAARNNVAFFRGSEIAAYCGAAGIRCREVRSYALSDAADLTLFAEERFDVLCVLGWERLIPEAILRTLSKFACGMHGSAFGLPRGRGRSPMNWSIITGQERFTTYLFRYTPGMDDGDIIGSRVFEINAHDTIETLHRKNRIAMLQVLTESLPKIAAGEVAFTPQPAGEPSYYPKRTPEDGLIDWRASTRAIDRLIRAVAPPYPGAFAYLDGRRIGIWAAQPFDAGLFMEGTAAGTIVDVSVAGGTFVVKTVDGSLLVTQFDGVTVADLRPGARLAGATIATDFTSRYGKDIPPSQWEIGPPAGTTVHE